MKEAQFQRYIIDRLHRTFDRPLILKNDSSLVQGIPDLSVFLPGRFTAFLEVKISEAAPMQPNQAYYIDLLQKMGFFAEFIYPENEEEVFRALQRSSRARR